VTGCLHLKSAVTALDEHTLLGNRAWFESSLIKDHDWVDVDLAEPMQGMLSRSRAPSFFLLALHARMHASKLAASGNVLDISELQKAESGLTCSSLLFEG
jgi:dimethylargininase